MIKETNVEEIREITKLLLLVEPEPVAIMPFFVYHPIFESVMVAIKENDENKFCNLNIPDEYDMIIDNYSKLIDTLSVMKCYILVRTAYKLTWVKYCKDFLSEKDFGEFLSMAWVDEENPNQDVNCSITYLTGLFQKCKKEHLMCKEDYENYKKLPDKFIVYRGVAVGRNPHGLSWTLNLETAQWFANRFNNDKETGYIEKAVVRKSDVFAYFNTRGEDEIVCNVSSEDIIILDKTEKIKKYHI